MYLWIVNHDVKSQSLHRQWEKLDFRKTKKSIHSGSRYSASKPIRFELGPDFMRRIQRLGNARAALPNLSEINRKVALRRWQRVRAVQQKPAA